MADPSFLYFAALQETREYHRTKKLFTGRYVRRYVPDIKMIVKKTRCKTLLDYGCGKGFQWIEPHSDTGMLLQPYLGIESVTKYDPGTEEFAAEPQGKYDIVICTQVLGCIPIVDLPWVVDRLYGFAKKAVYVGERLGPSKKPIHKHIEKSMATNLNHWEFVELLRSRAPGGVKCWFRSPVGLEEVV